MRSEADLNQFHGFYFTPGLGLEEFYQRLTNIMEIETLKMANLKKTFIENIGFD